MCIRDRFPRECPRVLAWTTPGTTDTDRGRFLGPGGGERVHAVEYGWLERLRTVDLYAYRFATQDFSPFGTPTPHAHVATVPVTPIAPPARVGNLLDLHAAAGIQLRVLPNLWGLCDAAAASTLGFSAIRMRNALPR